MFNKTLKKWTALGLTMVLAFSFVSCGGNKKVDTTPKPTQTTSTSTGEKRIITVGTWYDHYYTSDHKDVYDNPKVSDTEIAQVQLDNMREIEKKYNCEFRFKNLTWAGVISSINTSIMAGTPDCDIYEVDLQFGIPAVLNGYAQPLEDFLPADSDVFKDQVVMKYLNILGQDKNYLFGAQSKEANLGGYPLAFNADMIKEAGLENPQDLWDKGEWTWDKFREYIKVLTKDTNGDGVTDVYGYGGWFTTALSAFLMSNGAQIAGDTKTGVDSPATIEVFQLLYDIYNTDKSARPWNIDDWNDNNQAYKTGQLAFWIGAAWIFDGDGAADLPFEIGVVPWPVGPSGNQETNKQVNVAGSQYMIPSGVKDPKFVYDVFYDWTNWYKGDTSLRDTGTWFEDSMLTERNFKYLEFMGTKPNFDIWGSLNVNFNVVGLLNGEVTPAQLAEESKQLFQDALDTYFGN